MAINYTLPQLLRTLVDQGASDLHISANSAPRLRIDGHLIPLQLDALSGDDCRKLIYSVLTENQKKDFETRKEIDFAFSVQNLARFRGNVYLQKNFVSAAFRIIPYQIKTIDELGLPPVVNQLCSLPRGLVLVTGSTGSGKSTTLAAMIDFINRNRYDHILTIEDPVEYVHAHLNSVVNQREVGEDTKTFAQALKSSLRQDPDVVMLGELRDLETIALALTAAETGHLVFATMHTNGCVSTLNRIVDAFPPHQQSQIRTQLSMTLEAVLSQTLLPAVGGGRVMALEIMVQNQAVRALINEGKFNQIYSAMQTGQEDSGMQTLNQSLASLIEKRMIDKNLGLVKIIESHRTRRDSGKSKSQ